MKIAEPIAASLDGAPALLRRAEEELAEGSPGSLGRAPGLLAALDRVLLSALWREQRDRTDQEEGVSRPLAGACEGYLFYRKTLLKRLAARRARIGPELLRSLYAGASSPRLILLVTHACQLRCAYCRVRRHPARMAPETAEAGVRWLLAGLRREVELQFFGGEPLLAFDVVRQAALMAESLAERSGKKVKFLLTTNGISLSEKALQFFRDHRFSLEFSCDGGHRTQLAQRAASGGGDYYEKLAANLESLRAAGVGYQVIAVVTPESVGRLDEEFRYLADLGHGRIQLNYALGRYWDEESKAGLLSQLRKIARLAQVRGVELVNGTAARREPVVLNSELTVDCDGGVFRETGVCLEEDFLEMKARFFVADVARAGLFDAHGSTQFDNLALLVGAYGAGGLRRTLLNNLDLGVWLERNPPWGRDGGGVPA